MTMRAPRSIAGLVFLGLLGFAAFFWYSWGWSERFLAPLRVGMSKSQVESLVGHPPHVRTNAGAETWDYTRAWSRDARVYFSTNGFVWAIEKD
jgi:hypothetical protein